MYRIPLQKVWLSREKWLDALDHEVGRLMTETGLATRATDGSLTFHPETTNTMVIIIGDNGSFAPTVKAPFIPTKSKASVYQTGVWVPLIIAGPLVKSPDRVVKHMINVVDLFQLFGEIAGLDVRKEVPISHTLDSEPVLPYLVNPNQESIRTNNFTQTANNIRATDTVIPPCVFEQFNTCVQLFTTEKLCASEQGIWYGPDNPDYPDGLQSCCEVKTTVPGQEDLEILPVYQTAVRDDEFKLVVRELQDCSGDGNLDKLVNTEDLQNWENLATDWGASSVYDFNFDGLTSDPDLSIISENLGSKCRN